MRRSRHCNTCSLAATAHALPLPARCKQCKMQIAGRAKDIAVCSKKEGMSGKLSGTSMKQCKACLCSARPDNESVGGGALECQSKALYLCS